MLLSLRKNGLTSLFKEVRVFKVVRAGIGVFYILGLKKAMFVSNISDTTTPSLPPTP